MRWRLFRIFLLRSCLGLLALRGSAHADWTRQFGGSSSDYGFSVEVDSTGSVVVGVITNTALFGQPHSGGSDALVVKLSPTGATLWARQFGSPTHDTLNAVAVTPTNQIVAAGSTHGAFPGFPSAGSTDAFVRMYDSAGAVLWTRQFGTTGDDSIEAVATDGLGGIYLGGGSQDSGAFVMKLDNAGVTQWTHLLAPFGALRGLAVNAAGTRIYAGGETQGTLPGETSSGSGDATVFQFDGNGTILWNRQFGSAGKDRVFDLAIDSAGAVVVGGETTGTLPGQTSAGNYDAFLRKLDVTGTTIWTKQFGTSNDDSIKDVDVNASGQVLAVGLTGGTLAPTPMGDRDSFVQALEGNGTVLLTQQFGTAGDDVVSGVAFGANGGRVMVGQTTGTFPGQTKAGEYDVFVLQATQAVPEPCSAVLLTLGMLGLASRRQR